MCKLCKPRNKGKCLKLKGTGLKDISYSFNRSINVIYQSNMIFIIIMLCQREGFKKKILTLTGWWGSQNILFSFHPFCFYLL